MKKFLIYLPFIALLLSSCEFDDSGEICITNSGWLLLGLVFFILVFIIRIGGQQQKETEEEMKKEGIDYFDFVSVGEYVGGHPRVDTNKGFAHLRKQNGCLKMYQIPVANISLPIIIGGSEISINDIANITIEDASSLEHKVTLGRILLVGVFALAWRKKKKNELAFVVIEWQKGKFSHSTTFSFEGKDAMQKANTARNRLIEMCE